MLFSILTVTTITLSSMAKKKLSFWDQYESVKSGSEYEVIPRKDHIRDATREKEMNVKAYRKEPRFIQVKDAAGIRIDYLPRNIKPKIKKAIKSNPYRRVLS